MKAFQWIFSSALGLVIFATGCAHVRVPSEEKYVASFGLIDEADNVIPTNRIPHRVGESYGWELTVCSSKPQVHVKEVFRLPSSAPWISDPRPVPEGLKTVTDQKTATGDLAVHEYELKIGMTGPNESTILQPYLVIPGDPQGKHSISLYVDGKLVKKFKFQVVGE